MSYVPVGLSNHPLDAPKPVDVPKYFEKILAVLREKTALKTKDLVSTTESLVCQLPHTFGQ